MKLLVYAFSWAISNIAERWWEDEVKKIATCRRKIKLQDTSFWESHTQQERKLCPQFLSTNVYFNCADLKQRLPYPSETEFSFPSVWTTYADFRSLDLKRSSETKRIWPKSMIQRWSSYRMFLTLRQSFQSFTIRPSSHPAIHISIHSFIQPSLQPLIHLSFHPPIL